MADRMPVGQVWIRVSPDTRGFARETRRELQKMKSLDKYKVPIEVEVDIEKIQDDFDKAVKNLQDTADKVTHRILIQTELDWRQGDARRQIRDQLEHYQGLADNQRVRIKTNLDSDGASTSPYSPTIDLNVNDRQFERDVKRLMEKTKADLKVSVDKKSLGEELKEATDEVGGFLRRLMDQGKNKLQIQVETKNLHDAEMRLAALQKHYDGAAEATAATGRELKRVTAEYNNISRRLGQMRWDLADINTETKEGAEEYRLLASRMVALNKQLRMFGDERKRLMDFGRKNWLEVETNVESMRKAEEEIEELRDRVNEIASEIEVGLDRTSVAAVSAELFTLVRPRIVSIYTRIVNHRGWKKFWNDADASAARLNANLAKYATQITGLRLLYKTVEDLVQVVPKLDMMIPSLAAGSVAAVTAISAVSGLLGSILTIGADMLRVFNLVLALPSVLAGLVGSVLILGRSFKDFEARFPEIISYWKQLGDTVSGRVWDRAEAKVRKLHRALVPLLNAHVPDWASAWGDSLGALADGLRAAVDEGHLTEFLENSIKGTKAAERGWESLGSALLRMVGIGSRFFPDLGTWFSDTMETFEDWVKKNDKNGNFERWIEDGIRAFNDLGRVIRATGSILRSLAIASRAAGLPTLTEFADGMSSLADKMRSPEFRNGFTGPLENMVGLLKEVSTLTPLIEKSLGRVWTLAGQAALELKGPLTGALEGILTQFTSGQFQEDITSFFEDIGTFIEDITPGLESLVREFGSMAAVVGVAAKSWGPAFNQMLLLFEDLGRGMRPGLESFLEKTGPKLEELVKDLRPEVEKLGTAIGDLLGNESFQNFVTYLLDALGNILTLSIRVGIALLGAFKGFAEWWDQQPEWFKTLSAHLIVIAFAAPLAAAGFKAITRALGPLIALLGGLWKALRLAALGMSALGTALITWGARGGIAGLIARAIGRGLLVGSGPVGWFALLASVLPVNIGGEILNAIVQILFPDSWAGRLSDEITRRIREATGGKTILGFAWEHIKLAFGDNGLWLHQRIWHLAVAIFPPFLFWKIVGEVLEDFFFVGDNPIGRFVVEIYTQALMWAHDLTVGLENAWNVLKAAIDNWQPKSPLGSAAKWLYEKMLKPIVDWLLGTGGSAAEEVEEAFGANSAFTSDLAEGIKKALNGTWDKLKRTFTDWEPGGGGNPIGLPSIGGIAGWVKKHLVGDDPATDAETAVQEAFGQVIPRVGSAMESGTAALKASLGPEKNESGDGFLTRRLGMGSEETAKIAKRAAEIQDTTGSMSRGVQESYRGLQQGAGRSVRDLVSGVAERFGHLSRDGQGKARDLDAGASKSFRSMSSTGLFQMDSLKSGATDKAGSMESGVVARMAAMSARGAAQMLTMQGAVTSRAAGMQTAVLAQMTMMSVRGSAQMAQMQTAVSARAVAMQTAVSARAVAMQAAVLTQMVMMSTRGAAQMGAMQAAVSTRMGAMQAMAAARAAGMQAAVLTQMAMMSARSGAQMVQMQAAILRAMSAIQAGIVSRGRAMSTAYAVQMTSMMSRSISIVGRLRDTLLRVLTINASGPGRSTGSSYANGLSAGLSRAAGVARAIRGGVLSALTFSAYSAGSSVGGTFAAGIRSRVGAAVSAANALAAAVRRRMPHSPAKEGPLSGSGWGGWGESIAEELANGLRRGSPEVAGEASLLMQGVHDALDTKAEVGFGVSTAALNDAFAGAEIRAAELSESQLTAGDIENGVANGLTRLIEPAGDRDIVALVRRANKNGAR